MRRPGPGRPWWRRAIVFLCAACAVWLVATRAAPGCRGRQGPTAPQPAQPRAGVAQSVSGDYLAYTVEARGAAALRVAEPDRRATREIARRLAIGSSPVWSADGSWVAYVAGSGPRMALYASPIGGGRPSKLNGSLRIGPVANASHWMQWSPAGEWLAFAVPRPAEPGDPRVDVYVTAPGADQIQEAAVAACVGASEPAGHTIAWSPDGQWLAACTRRVISLLRPADGRVQTVSLDGIGIVGFRWSPDARKLLLFAPDDDYRAAAYVYDLPADALRRVASGLGPGLASWSGDGSALVLVPDPARQPGALLSWQPGQRQARLLSETRRLGDYAWFPGAPRLVACALGGPEPGLLVIGLNGAPVRKLAAMGGLTWPVPSPDGARVAFCASEGPKQGLYVVGAAGGQPQLLLEQLPEAPPEWSPDGSALLVRARSETRHTIDALVLPIASGSAPGTRLNGSIDVARCLWSPSGRHVLLLSSEGAEGPGGVLAVATPGEARWIVDENVRYASWCPAARPPVE